MTTDACLPPELRGPATTITKIAAGVFVAMSLVAETGERLVARGIHPVTFVSPNVEGVEKDHNQQVFEQFSEKFFPRR